MTTHDNDGGGTVMPSRETIRSDERGMAMIVVLFMVLILSVLGLVAFLLIRILVA